MRKLLAYGYRCKAYISICKHIYVYTLKASASICSEEFPAFSQKASAYRCRHIHADAFYPVLKAYAYICSWNSATDNLGKTFRISPRFRKFLTLNNPKAYTYRCRHIHADAGIYIYMLIQLSHG